MRLGLRFRSKENQAGFGLERRQRHVFKKNARSPIQKKWNGPDLENLEIPGFREKRNGVVSEKVEGPGFRQNEVVPIEKKRRVLGSENGVVPI